ADVYALGTILYEMLTGRPPFRAASLVDTYLQVLHDEPLAPHRLQPKLPRDLETICLKCLEKAPARRYASARELAEDLHRCLAGEPIRARPTGPGERALKWARRHPTGAALGVVSTLAVLTLLGGILVSAYHRTRLAEQDARVARHELNERLRLEELRRKVQ